MLIINTDFVTYSLKGINRDINKDGVFSLKTDSYDFFCVLDGVSSSEDSLKAVNLIKVFFEDEHSRYLNSKNIKEAVTDLLLDANNKLLASGIDGKTTLTAILLDKKTSNSFVYNLGDSRAYESNSQFLKQLTTDHSIDTNRSILTRCLGMLSLSKEDIEIISLEIRTKSRILLCTDGFYSVLEKEPVHFNNLLQKDFRQVEQTIASELAGKNQDDATFILIQFNV